MIPWRGIPECQKHRISGDDKICKGCNLKHMCGTWIEIDRKQKKKEKVGFTKVTI